MSKRRGNGEGCISQRADGYWIGQITLGFDQFTLKQIRKTVSAKTRKECTQKLQKLIEEKNHSTLVLKDKQILENWVTEWLELYKKHTVKQKTYDNYLAAMKHHIKPILGKIQLQKLSSMIIQKFINTLIDKGIAAATIRYTYTVLSCAIKQAVRLKYIGINPCIDISLPTIQREEVETLTTEQVKKFLTTAQEYYLYPAFLIQATTGLRRGEALGLRWENIYLDRGYLTISQQIVDSASGIWVDTPKTKYSRRNVPLPPKVIDILQKYKKDSGWVASTNKGNYINPRNYSRSFDMLLKQAGLPKIKLHVLRHTFATLMVANGVDLKSVSQIVGHSQVAFTAQIYTHPDMETKQRAIAKIDNILFN